MKKLEHLEHWPTTVSRDNEDKSISVFVRGVLMAKVQENGEYSGPMGILFSKAVGYSKTMRENLIEADDARRNIAHLLRDDLPLARSAELFQFEP